MFGCNVIQHQDKYHKIKNIVFDLVFSLTVIKSLLSLPLCRLRLLSMKAENEYVMDKKTCIQARCSFIHTNWLPRRIVSGGLFMERLPWKRTSPEENYVFCWFFYYGFYCGKAVNHFLRSTKMCNERGRWLDLLRQNVLSSSPFSIFSIVPQRKSFKCHLRL